MDCFCLFSHSEVTGCSISELPIIGLAQREKLHAKSGSRNRSFNIRSWRSWWRGQRALQQSCKVMHCCTAAEGNSDCPTCRRLRLFREVGRDRYSLRFLTGTRNRLRPLSRVRKAVLYGLCLGGGLFAHFARTNSFYGSRKNLQLTSLSFRRLPLLQHLIKPNLSLRSRFQINKSRPCRHWKQQLKNHTHERGRSRVHHLGTKGEPDKPIARRSFHGPNGVSTED